jgi:hypothetical protein
MYPSGRVPTAMATATAMAMVKMLLLPPTAMMLMTTMVAFQGQQ